MTLSLVRECLRTHEQHRIGYARSVVEADKLLVKAAKAEARTIGRDADVRRQKEGYVVIDDRVRRPDPVALYTFTDSDIETMTRTKP